MILSVFTSLFFLFNFYFLFFSTTGVAILLGFIFAFAGYRYFSATLFLCGAAAAGFISFVVIDTYQPDEQTSKPAVVLGVTLTLALIVGILCVYLRKIGTFLAGAAGAASAAFMLNAAVLNKFPAPDALPGLWLYLAVVVLGLIGGVLALKLERFVLVLSTSLAGSLACVAGIGHFAGHFPTSASSFIDPATHAVTHDVWVWAYACGFLVSCSFNLFFCVCFFFFGIFFYLQVDSEHTYIFFIFLFVDSLFFFFFTFFFLQVMVVVSTIVQFKTTVDRETKKKDQKYKNSLLYTAPEPQQRTVYVDHVSGYNTAV